MLDIEDLARTAIDCGFQIHKRLGPGLLESAYEVVLEAALMKRGLSIERQKPIGIRFDDILIADAFRADLIVEGRLIIEIKSVERTTPVHAKQLLTYLRLMEQPVGLLMVRDVSRRPEKGGERPLGIRPETAIADPFVPLCLRVQSAFPNRV